MKIIQLNLYLLIWSHVVQTLTDQLIDLGQNVTLNCDFDVKEVNWLLVNLPNSPLLILRFSTTAATFYYNQTFRLKYSVQSKHRLFIKNVTINELGIYYCVTTDEPHKYSDGTRLLMNVSTPEIRNHTVVQNIEKNETQWWIISLIVSALLNGVLIIVITGLVKVFVLGGKRAKVSFKQDTNQDTNLQQTQALDLEQAQNSTQVEYTAPNFSKPCKKFQCKPINDTYALLNLPNA